MQEIDAIRQIGYIELNCAMPFNDMAARMMMVKILDFMVVYFLRL